MATLYNDHGSLMMNFFKMLGAYLKKVNLQGAMDYNTITVAKKLTTASPEVKEPEHQAVPPGAGEDPTRYMEEKLVALLAPIIREQLQRLKNG